MNGQQIDRCDRTAYVSGLQPTITDIELFELFNRVAHVEKVIVRNGAVRHALVVFKTVEGLYHVLVHFQDTHLHGRLLHIRPLRESSHSSSETLATMVEKAKSNGRNQNRRPASVQDRYTPSPLMVSSGGFDNQPRAYRNASEPYGRRHSDYRGYQQYPPVNYGYPAYSPNMSFENGHVDSYAEGARRFDNLANIIRSSTPADPFSVQRKTSDPHKPRPGSARDYHHHNHQPPPPHKTGPPTWKMELQIKKEPEEPQLQRLSSSSMSPQQFLAQIAHAEQMSAAEQRKKRPNLSVINPSLFYDMYPRTSSPVCHRGPQVRGHENEPIQSPHDPAVLAYSRLKASEFAEVSPIDINDCSFVTKHFGVSGDTSLAQQGLPQQQHPMRRDMTNDELSDLIVSTGNLRIAPELREQLDDQDHEPAPWSPVKRLRAESGCQSSAHQFASPQFSPIGTKFAETEDDVFHSEHRHSEAQESIKQFENELLEAEHKENVDINNSRLPSNSHSANPGSAKKEFVFPSFPLCRHSSVPSLAHLVGDLSDGHFGCLDPHVTIDRKLAFDHSNPSDGNPRDATQADKSPLYNNF